MFTNLRTKFSKKRSKYEVCYVIFPQICWKLCEFISNHIAHKFSIDCKSCNYQTLSKTIVQEINNNLQKPCIFILGYIGSLTSENCYKLGLAHAYKSFVILIDLKLPHEENCIEIPSYIKYNFIIQQRITKNQDITLVLTNIERVIYAILSGDILNLLYQEALGMCEYLERNKGYYIVKSNKEEFIQTLTDKDIELYFTNYNISYQVLLQKIVKNKEILGSIYSEPPIDSEPFKDIKDTLIPPILPIKLSMPEPTTRNQVFISYSHQDQQWLTKLQTHLKPMIRNQTFVAWDDTKIQPGAKWREEIEKALAAAKVAVLLVSPDFLASDFIADNELPPLLDAAEAEGLTIIWIPLTYSGYEETEIEKYQSAHPPNKPLESLSPAQENQAWVKICQQIKAAILR
ncbi:MAG: TIR domain-containing protein [Nostoc sp. EkiNYC01]|nr:TIR domain-containing protein [Nostoc sp. EkiNYC01]